MRKFISLMTIVVLLVCSTGTVFATAVDSSTGIGTADVPLTIETPQLIVTVPTSIPVSVDSRGIVTTATDLKLINGSHGSIKISNVIITPASSWSVMAFDSDMSNILINTKSFGFQMRSDTTDATSFKFTQDNWPIVSASNATATDELPITYSAKIPAQSTAISNATIASIIFTVNWA